MMHTRRSLAMRWAGVVMLAAMVVAWRGVERRARRTFPTPSITLTSTRDSAVVARGKSLVYGAAACAYCHVPKEQWPALNAGDTPPLSGDHVFRLPFGDFYSPNLTPDSNTGIGSRSDAELARVLRYGIRADARAAFPFMEFHGMSDDDVVAVLSYLRAQPAVPQPVPAHRLNALGTILMAFMVKPPPVAIPVARSPVGLSAERGRYLANNVSLCVTCHTDRSRRDGSFRGPPFAGGQKMDVADFPDLLYVPPNLTPDSATSPIGRWSEDEFVARFRRGELQKGTPMPWGAFARMDDDELRSIYRYLRTLAPVRNETGAVVQRK